MPSPPSTPSLGVHPPSPRLLSDDIAPANDAASCIMCRQPSVPSHTNLLSSLPPRECRADGIAAWRETTPLAHLLAHHRCEDEEANLPPVGQESSRGQETVRRPLAGVLATAREPAVAAAAPAPKPTPKPTVLTAQPTNEHPNGRA